MSKLEYLVVFDPSGRMGTAGGEEPVKVSIEGEIQRPMLASPLLNGLREIVSAHTNIDIEFLDIYEKIN